MTTLAHKKITCNMAAIAPAYTRLVLWYNLGKDSFIGLGESFFSCLCITEQESLKKVLTY